MEENETNEEKEQYGEFVNIMNFKIPLRLTWIEGKPSIELLPGKSIFGPVKLLSQFQFLAPIPIQMHTVSSVITNQDGSYQDIGEDHNEVIGNEDGDNEITTEFPEIETLEEQTVSKEVSKYDMTKLPFDLKNVNWLTMSCEDLEDAADKIGINISPYLDIESKKIRRWELVRAIKEAAKDSENLK